MKDYSDLRYAIVTPVLNEGENIEALIESGLNQTLKPSVWVFVNDGCTDNTVEIIEKYRRNHNELIKVDHLMDSAYSSGSKIARAVLFGIDSIDLNDFDFISKIDADIELPSDYFESVAREFYLNNDIGLCGGVCALPDVQFSIEVVSDIDHVRGALKSYRTKAYKEMEGIRAVEGWDSLDELLLRYYGWKVKVLHGNIVIHKRKTDTRTGIWKAAIKTGRGFRIMGYNFPVAFLASLKLITKPPYLASFFLAMFGYLGYILRGIEPELNKDQRRFANKYRLKKMKQKSLKRKNVKD